MGSIPMINVYNKKLPKRVDPNFAGRVAIIGAFKTTATTPKIYDTLTDAQSELGTDTTFNGCKMLPILFGEGLSDINGVTSILAVNIATEEEEVWTKDITTTNLTSALASIKHERFDTLLIAIDNLTDAFIPIITTFNEERALHKNNNGWLGGIIRTGADTAAIKAAYKATVDICDDYLYGLIPNQPLDVNGTSLDFLETIAYYAALVSSTNVGYSLTQKILPGVTGLGSEYTYEDGDLGTYLVELGLTCFQCVDRENSEYVIVNSEQPNGYDLYINRVRDYVFREMDLRRFLGERNRAPTLSEIVSMLGLTKDRCVDNLDFLADIIYTVEKVAPKKAQVTIEKLLFDDIIIIIDVYYTIEVQ